MIQTRSVCKNEAPDISRGLHEGGRRRFGSDGAGYIEDENLYSERYAVDMDTAATTAPGASNPGPAQVVWARGG